MKTRLLLSFALVLLVSLAFTSFALAEPCMTSTGNGNVRVCLIDALPSSQQAGTSIPVRFNVSYTGIGTGESIVLSNSTVNIGSWNLQAGLTINAGEVKNITGSISIPQSTTNGAIIAPILRAKVGSNPEVELSLPTVQVNAPNSFCSAGPRGNLSITDFNIDNADGDDDEWRVFDEIEIEIEVENNGDDEIEDVIVELGLFDSSGNNVADELDFIDDDEKVNIGDLDDDDRETVTFAFRVPGDLDDDRYEVRAKAYEEGAQSIECTEEEGEDIDVELEDDEGKFIIIDDIFFPESATCLSEVTGSFEVFNVGEDDQDRVQISMNSRELNLSQIFEITEDLDTGDSEVVNFNFLVPRNVKDGTYIVQFRTFYDYDDGEYDQQSDETFVGRLRVLGCTGGTGSPTGGNNNVLVTASLDSDAQSGQPLMVRATVTNTASEQRMVTFDVTGYSSWAEVTRISPRIIPLAPGQTTTVDIELAVDEDATGTQSFIIQTTSNGILDTQEVEVTIEGESSGMSWFNFTGSSSLIWIIAIVNVVLIVLIILVAVRLSRK